MAVLNFNKPKLSRTIRFDGLAFTPPRQRGKALPQTRIEPLTVSGDVDPGAAITLAKVSGSAWLTVAATCLHGVSFTVTIDASQLRPGQYSETIRATRAGYALADLVVSLNVQPVGAAP